MVSVCVVSLNSASDEKAKSLGAELGAPYELSTRPTSTNEQAQFLHKFDFFLEVSEQLRLVNQAGLSFEIDFDGDHIHYQKKQLGKRDLLPRAVGIDKDYAIVHDLSCGMGRDSVILSSLGFQVFACERNQILWLMLTAAQKQSTRKEIHQIHFIHKNSIDHLQSLPTSKLREHSFYFDPMFPEKKKDALPKKEMQIFKALVGDDDDASAVVRKAADLKVSRFVVKRPMRAPPLFEKPHHSLEGKLIRYDVYLF